MNILKDIRFSYLLLAIAISSLFYGFYIDEDSAGSGGFILDFNKTWNFVISLKNEMNFLSDEYSIHTPLHYLILSQVLVLTESQNLTRLIYFLGCFSIPFLFYLCLKLRYSRIKKINLIAISSLLFFLPSFRSSIIWPNSSSTALIFFLAFLYFFIVWNKKAKEQRIELNIEIFLQTFFLALAVYTRQYYAYIYVFLIFVYLKNLKFKNFLIVCSFVFLLALPGFYLVLANPKLIVSFDLRFINTILVSSSIISFYLLPIYFLNFLHQKKLNDFFKKFSLNDSLPYFLIIFISIVMISFFDYNYRIGGGFFLKLSRLIFENNILFLITSIIGLSICFNLIKEDKSNLFLILIILLGFSYHMIFQKYFEPMFLFIYLFMINSEIKDNFIKNLNSVYILNLYFIIYLISAILNDTYKITNYLP
ncbi:MAG: hypothetical protein CL687_03340 [Candidatus Pelagibacter sp.]|nr:hypothetical protein [Candidatus Pelagibacter sp.]